ncbi:WD40 repeat domain-containing protein [Aquisphaera insulae]|uniref:WD40 repeat domain-containing protein n=1 Tax=Aquisphaera insulae TaxID=2712864 RepID=UPI0013EADE56|nr:WD40 repeat domain-containing protein [Aquisphaera insulae]
MRRVDLVRRSSPHPGRGSIPRIAAIGLLGLGLAAGAAVGQDEVRNYRKPVLVVETGGHHARVRSLLWQGEATLLSGGEDKTVKVWDLQDRPRLARTLRPMIWRGAAGTIYAMALSRPDPQGQSFLAVAGIGVESRRGDMTIFRFPGSDGGGEPGSGTRQSTGEVFRRLMPPPEGNPAARGHTRPVLGLAFDPAGRTMASCAADGTAILWDVPAFTPRAVLAGHEGQVRAVAFSPDGGRVATTGADGTTRLWDAATGAALDRYPANDRGPSAINTLAFGPSSIVIGREAGEVFRFDARGLTQFPIGQIPMQAGRGPIEFLAFSPDGTRLAICLKSDRADPIDPPGMASVVEIRQMPAGDLLRSFPVPGQVLACAFSPSGRRLAFAGGHSASVFVHDMTRLDAAPAELKGTGSTPFDLAFTADSRTITFVRDRGGPNAPAQRVAFDLAGRITRRLDPREPLSGPIPAVEGWSLRGNLGTFVLEAVNQDGRVNRLIMSRATDRNWWCSTMIPAGPGHPRATVAVGCEAGVAVFDLATGERTRYFAAHSSPVVSVVPSPDGKWLASSSVDQTIQFYPLEGCDVRPALGATFVPRPDGTWMTTEVQPRGFAAAFGLLRGDVIKEIGVQRPPAPEEISKPDQIEAFLDRARLAVPSLDVVAFKVRRRILLPPPFGMVEVEMPQRGTSKRNSAALSLILGTDREWVCWTPQGFYDTSIAGDARHLGWHINPDYRASRSTDFVPIGTYAATMLQPRVLEQVWGLGSIDRAAAALGMPAGLPTFDLLAFERQPPAIEFAPVRGGVRLPAPGILWTLSQPDPSVEVRIAAPAWSQVTARRIIVDGEAINLRPLAAPATVVQESVKLQLQPRRRVRLAVEATSVDRTRRSDWVDMIYLPPPVPPPAPPRPKPGRLVVLAVGNGLTRNPDLLPAVPFADSDAVTMAGAISGHLVTRDGDPCDRGRPEDSIILAGADADSRRVNQSLRGLFQRINAKQLRREDVIAVVIASHVLSFGNETHVAVADSALNGGGAIQPSIPATEISDILGRLSDYGCRVLVFVDGVHQLPEGAPRSDVKAWIRDLRENRGVICFVASKEGPSDTSRLSGQGVFAQGVVAGLQGVGNASYSLEDFRLRLVQQVRDLSERVQEADGFYPDSVDPQDVLGKP